MILNSILLILSFKISAVLKLRKRKITIYTNDLKTSPATCKLMDVDVYMLFKEQLGATERKIQS